MPDNTLDRKSSQAYVMVLFGGVVGWQADKQNAITTSTTASFAVKTMLLLLLQCYFALGPFDSGRAVVFFCLFGE